MSERISTWKLEEEGSSGRHLTGKRHSRRIQPRSLLSLLLSARRPFSPRPSRPPRKGCALFPSTRSASVSARRPLARTIRRSRNKIFTENSNVAISSANYKNRLSVASRTARTVRRCLASRKKLRDSQKRQIAISRLLRKTMKNNARDSWNYIHRYDSVISTRTMDTEGGYVLAGTRARGRREKKAGEEKERTNR